jgi:hypothetical protein
MADDRRDALAREMERTLAALAAEHERLRAINSARKRAISVADTKAMAVCLGQENEVVQRIAALDRDRELIVRKAVERFGPPARSPAGRGVTLTWIASRFDEPDRSRLIMLASRLRDLIAVARSEAAAVAQAADARGRAEADGRGVVLALRRRRCARGARFLRGPDFLSPS